MNEFFRRLRYLLNRRRFDRELAGDMEFHREMAAREGGQNFGNTLRLREEARDAWGWTWIDRLAQDLRYAARMLRKAPGFTVAAVSMLAIGIGANVAAFSFFDLMFLRPLNVKDPDTLLRFHRRASENYAYALPFPEMAFFREHSKTLSAVLAKNITALSIEGEPKPIEVHFVSANFFTELGALPALGTLIDTARDEGPGAAPVAVLSHGFWQSHFGADPLVVGKAIHLNGKAVTVIGVARPEFNGLSLKEPAAWAPLGQQPYIVAGSQLLTDYSSGGVQMWGRLQPGLTPSIAGQELQSLAAQLHRQHPAEIWDKETLPSEPGGFATGLMIGNRSGTGSERTDGLLPLAALAGTLVLLILAVACGNLGSLLLARGVAREREIVIRSAVGAGSARLIRQLFTESLLLAGLGAAAGLILGSLLLKNLMVWTGAPGWLNPAPDWRIVAFSVAAGFLSAILFGLAPAVHVAKRRHRATIARQILVGAQIAASCVLLIVAALLGRAMEHAMLTNPGFDYQNVLSIDPGLSRNGYSNEKARAYLDLLQTRLRALPGVASVSLTLTPPLGHVSIGAGIDVDGRHLEIQVNHTDSHFFETMKIPVLRGRNLRIGDTHAMVVSDSFARTAWPGQDPLGRKFTMGEDYTVVGVSGSARSIKLEDSDSVEAYFPIEPSDFPRIFALVRTSGPPEDSVRSAVSLARSLDPRVFPDVQLLKTGFHEKLREAESGALAVSLLGFIAHLLACLGIVGVVAYAVSQRTKEIGIRMALGAKPAHVLSIVLRQFSVPVIAGLTVGVGAAAALSTLLRSVLYGVSNFDPFTYLAAIGIFIVTVSIAALLPARRALRINPVTALRHE